MSVGFCHRYESERQSARALIIDRDREATTRLASMLGELGYDVSYAFDARLALLYGRKSRPQVAFLDLKTPHGGLHLIEAFRNEATLAGCALIALSENPSDAGFDACLAKPVGVPELKAALRPFVPAAKHGETTVAQAIHPVHLTAAAR